MPSTATSTKRRRSEISNASRRTLIASRRRRATSSAIIASRCRGPSFKSASACPARTTLIASATPGSCSSSIPTTSPFTAGPRAIRDARRPRRGSSAEAVRSSFPGTAASATTNSPGSDTSSTPRGRDRTTSSSPRIIRSPIAPPTSSTAPGIGSTSPPSSSRPPTSSSSSPATSIPGATPRPTASTSSPSKPSSKPTTIPTPSSMSTTTASRSTGRARRRPARSTSAGPPPPRRRACRGSFVLFCFVLLVAKIPASIDRDAQRRSLSLRHRRRPHRRGDGPPNHPVDSRRHTTHPHSSSSSVGAYWSHHDWSVPGALACAALWRVGQPARQPVGQVASTSGSGGSTPQDHWHSRVSKLGLT
mmetsp:Transcript_5432/g.13959  ORF Transcript_5432/g.13959 Transcript_5432/m.13959 type:complete len:362 (-) Transcript_5432:52-1137(-)